jgi:predicted DNA-binding ribbon-helix-helix protein
LSAPASSRQTSIKKRSVVVAGHRTSVSLETAFWDTLRDMAGIQGKTVNRLITEIDQGRGGNLSSAIRIFILKSLLATSAPRSDRPLPDDEAPGNPQVDHLTPGID